MKTLRALVASLALALCCAPLLTACGSGVDEAPATDDALTAARKRKHHCQKDADCNPGQICKNNYCQSAPPPPPPPGTCTSNADCPSGQVCTSGQCTTPPPPPPPPPGTCTTNADCPSGQVCTNGKCTTPPPPPPPPPPSGGCNNSDDCLSGGLCNSGSCSPMACQQRSSGRTGIRAKVQITNYLGVVAGTANGSHEMADGVLTDVLWIFDAAAKDTNNVHLAMNVKSAKDPSGLPGEIPLTVGQVIEVEGEYIPPTQATGSSGRAVIHFTHSGCGFVDINGTQYR